MAIDLMQVGQATGRKERFWIGGQKHDLDVYRIPLQYLYFNIENGRYADRMLRLQHENKGQQIDARKPKWANEIERMLAGEHRETTQDQAAFEKLTSRFSAGEEPTISTYPPADHKQYVRTSSQGAKVGIPDNFYGE